MAPELIILTPFAALVLTVAAVYWIERWKMTPEQRREADREARDGEDMNVW